ncbi:MAG: hypothetical protein HC878_00085 [Leptolyngbyaceae cyanobacterium SL_5_14]|nr:hypothetical protein [Leptolyngbyaceae cyanobacterium SL_5_14]
MESWKITAESAICTASFCYRKSLRDSWKIWNVISSDRAIELYRLIWRAIVLAAWIVWTLCQIAHRELNHLVDGAQEPTAAPQPVPVPDSSVPQPDASEPAVEARFSLLTCPVRCDRWTVTQVRLLAKFWKIPGYSRKTKEDLLLALL